MLTETNKSHFSYSFTKNKTVFKRLLKILGISILLGIVAIIGFYTAVKHNAFGPILTESELLNYKNETASLVLTEDEVIIGKYFQENRTNATYKDLPKHLIQALVATEDARYFEHKGVDSRSMLRVLFKSIILRNKRSGGGSTITQQLAKNISGRSSFGFLTMPVNKTKEIIQAQRIESVFSKEDILTLYLNTVSFGENVYGIETASQRYFNKKVNKLSIEESAVLIGILKANTFYNPHLNPKNALKRRNIVLQQMLHYNYLSTKEADSLSQLDLKLNYNNVNKNNISGHFIALVEGKANHIIDSINKRNKTNYDIKKDGLIINTSLNNEMQMASFSAFKTHLGQMQIKLNKQYKTSTSQKRRLNQLVDKQLKRLGISKDSANIKRKQTVFNWTKKQIDSISIRDSLAIENTILHAGLLAISQKTGAIKTYIGGINHQRYAYDQVFSKRQLASTFKPILYAIAIDYGKSPCDYLDNDEISLSDYEDWHPTNADKKFGGKYSLQGALLNSKNIPSINLYLETNFKDLDTIWNRLNFSHRLQNKPSTALGTANASLYEVANAYAHFANYGKTQKAYAISSITTANGTVIYERKTTSNKTVFKPKTATYINEILQNAINRGTGKRLRNTYKVTLPLAGKTGTSQDYTDAWFVGYNPDIVMVSRVGCNSPKIHFNNGLGSGGQLALPLVAKTLKAIENNPDLKSQYDSRFKTITPEDIEQLECEDFKEETDLEKFFDLFKSKDKTFDKAQERAKRKAERKRKREKRRAERRNKQ